MFMTGGDTPAAFRCGFCCCSFHILSALFLFCAERGFSKSRILLLAASSDAPSEIKGFGAVLTTFSGVSLLYSSVRENNVSFMSAVDDADCIILSPSCEQCYHI